MHFTNKETDSNRIGYETTHVNTVFDLVEYSDPVDLKGRCNGNGWNSVKTEKTFTNGLAKVAVQMLILFNVYDPWTVEYSCNA